MKKIIIFILFFIFLCIGCTTTRVLRNSIRSMYKQYQFDSICQVERLPNDLDKWHGNFLYDYETNKKIAQYIFIKNIDRKNEIIYTITVNDNDSVYYFAKRIVEKIQK